MPSLAKRAVMDRLSVNSLFRASISVLMLPLEINKDYSYTCQSTLLHSTQTQTKRAFLAGKEEETKKEHTCIWTELVNT